MRLNGNFLLTPSILFSSNQGFALQMRTLGFTRVSFPDSSRTTADRVWTPSTANVQKVFSLNAHRWFPNKSRHNTNLKGDNAVNELWHNQNYILHQKKYVNILRHFHAIFVWNTLYSLKSHYFSNVILWASNLLWLKAKPLGTSDLDYLKISHFNVRFHINHMEVTC